MCDKPRHLNMMDWCADTFGIGFLSGDIVEDKDDSVNADKLLKSSSTHVWIVQGKIHILRFGVDNGRIQNQWRMHHIISYRHYPTIHKYPRPPYEFTSNLLSRQCMIRSEGTCLQYQMIMKDWIIKRMMEMRLQLHKRERSRQCSRQCYHSRSHQQRSRQLSDISISKLTSCGNEQDEVNFLH